MDWPHAPIHRFGDAGVYFITAGTHEKQHFFRDPAVLDLLQNTLFSLAAEHHCSLQAWALFSNHYHLVVAADAGEDVRHMLTRLHTASARGINEHDGVIGRTVWFQFRDTQLTFERSWLARLRYTHENAVHHGLVRDAAQYRWCSAKWFADHARPSFVKTVSSMKIDAVKVYDDYPFGVR
ncbi:MAG TPA: transposase [Thermoanaerobaculia bacterium]|nr:transposase [Thermoanaerobaculia bacterium]